MPEVVIRYRTICLNQNEIAEILTHEYMGDEAKIHVDPNTLEVSAEVKVQEIDPDKWWTYIARDDNGK